MVLQFEGIVSGLWPVGWVVVFHSPCHHGWTVDTVSYRQVCNRDRSILCSFPASWINRHLQPLESMFPKVDDAATVGLGLAEPASTSAEETNLLSLAPNAGAARSRALAVPASDLPESELVMVRLGRNFLSKMTLENRPETFDCLATKYTVGDLHNDKREIAPLRQICACTLKDVPAAELIKHASLWSLEAVKILDASTLPGDGEGLGPGLLLVQMADSNAWGPGVARTTADNCNPFYIPDPDNDRDCQELLQKKLIKPLRGSPDQFFITLKGSQALRIQMLAGRQRSLDEFQQ